MRRASNSRNNATQFHCCFIFVIFFLVGRWWGGEGEKGPYFLNNGGDLMGI